MEKHIIRDTRITNKHWGRGAIVWRPGLREWLCKAFNTFILRDMQLLAVGYSDLNKITTIATKNIKNYNYYYYHCYLKELIKKRSSY